MPYLHYSDYKAWNPYSGDRYIAETSSPFFSDVDEIGKIRMLNTGRNFSKTRILERIFSEGALHGRMRAFVYYFIGSFTGMLVFIPIAFMTICASVFVLCKRFNSLLCISLLSVLSYIFFYCWLFPYNYYGGGQSIGNRYFLQMFPLLALMVYANPYKTKFINACSWGAFIISVAFLYHHHFNPSDAHVKVASSGWLQSFMPFEITQQWLSSEIGNRPVNGSLYPRTHNVRRIYYDVTFNVGGVSFFANTGSGRLQIRLVAGIGDEQLLKELVMNRKTFFADNGFYGNEGTHVWSKRMSKIFLKSNQGRIGMKLVPCITGTKIDISTRGELEKSSDGIYYVNTDNTTEEFIEICFSADKSAVPKHDPKSTDTRDLSFRLTLL